MVPAKPRSSQFHLNSIKVEEEIEIPVETGHVAEVQEVTSTSSTLRRVDYCLVVWLAAIFLLCGATLALILSKSFAQQSQALSLDFERSWWSMLSLFAVIPVVLGLYGFHIAVPTQLQVVLYTVEPVVAQGWETPRKIVEVERSRSFWPNGEFKGLPLAELRISLKTRRLWREWSGSNVFYKVNMSFDKWKSLCDRITFRLQCLNRNAYVSGQASMQSFLWVLVVLERGSQPVIALIRETLLDAIVNLEMTWAKLVDEHGNFAGCKSSVRRDDGEWIGGCGGRNCNNLCHMESKALFQLFRHYDKLNVHSGRIPETLEASGPNDRMVLGYVDLNTATGGIGKATKAVWKVHGWDDLL